MSRTLSPVHYLRGRLVADPTDFSIAFPFGGTELGDSKLIRFRPGIAVEELTATEFGQGAVDYLRVARSPVIAGVFREFDESSLAKIFPNVSTGSVSGKPLVEVQEFGATATKAGTLLSDGAFKLIVAPLELDHAPCLYFPNAVGLPGTAAEVALSTDIESGFPFAFQALPDTNGRRFQKGILKDLTL